MSKSEAIRVNVTPQTRRALRARARKHDVSEATIIRDALRRYLGPDGPVKGPLGP